MGPFCRLGTNWIPQRGVESFVLRDVDYVIERENPQPTVYTSWENIEHVIQKIIITLRWYFSEGVFSGDYLEKEVGSGGGREYKGYSGIVEGKASDGSGDWEFNQQFSYAFDEGAWSSKISEYTQRFMTYSSSYDYEAGNRHDSYGGNQRFDSLTAGEWGGDGINLYQQGGSPNPIGNGWCELPDACKDYSYDVKLRLLDPNRTASAPGTTEEIIRQGAIATGVATDGVSEGLVAAPFRDAIGSTPEQLGAITLRIKGATDNRYGTLGNGSTEVTVQNWIDVDGVPYAVTSYKAPRTSADTVNLANRLVVLEAVIAGQVVAEYPFMLYAPPLVTLHGVWSEGAIWQGLMGYLRGQGYPAASIELGDYQKYNASDFEEFKVRRALKFYIEAALNRARDKGIIATQVDVVGHSMGGLVTRAFAAQGPDYRNGRNFGQGYIGRLITVTTPHSGSPLANWLIDHQGAQMDSGTHLLQGVCDHADTLGACMRRLGKPIDQGAVAALTQGFNYNVIPYKAITAVAPETTDVEYLQRFPPKIKPQSKQ